MIFCYAQELKEDRNDSSVAGLSSFNPAAALAFAFAFAFAFGVRPVRWKDHLIEKCKDPIPTARICFFSVILFARIYLNTCVCV